MPIIRSLSTAVAASRLPLEHGGSSVVGRGWSELLSKLILFMVIKETHLLGSHIPVVCSTGEQVGCCRQHICISMSVTYEVTGKNVAN